MLTWWTRKRQIECLWFLLGEIVRMHNRLKKFFQWLRKCSWQSEHFHCCCLSDLFCIKNSTNWWKINIDSFTTKELNGKWKTLCLLIWSSLKRKSRVNEKNEGLFRLLRRLLFAVLHCFPSLNFETNSTLLTVIKITSINCFTTDAKIIW